VAAIIFKNGVSKAVTYGLSVQIVATVLLINNEVVSSNNQFVWFEKWVMERQGL